MPHFGEAIGGGRADYTYIIEFDGTNYNVYDHLGLIVYSNPDKATAVQWAIDHAHDGIGGVIKTYQVTLPETGLTTYEDTPMFENYAGTRRLFKTMPDSDLYKFGLQNTIIGRPSIPYMHPQQFCPCNLFKDNSICIAMRDDSTNAGSISTFGTHGYGTYEWKAKVADEPAGLDQYVGFAERFPICYKDSIFVWWDGTNHRFETYAAGVSTNTNLAAQDWTTERDFKVVWAVNDAELFVDGGSVAHHFANVPNGRLIMFIEISRTAGGPVHSYVYGREWQQTA